NPDPVIELSDEGNCFELDMNGLDTSPNICNLTNYKDIKISYDINCPISGDGFNKATYLIDIHQDDEDVVDDFEFTLVYFDCTLDQNPERIDEYTLWEDYIVKNHDDYIQNGGALEITGLVGMAPGTNIFVETGGQLLLNGGKITNVCDAFWEGIDVWGDTYLSQYPFSNQGYVRITNGGTIAHADDGIQVSRIINGEYYYGTTGGIIKCDSAFFSNNNTDVSFYSYTNFSPYSQADMPNASYFKNTCFINDEICIKEKYVSLNTVDGIKFKGCSFTNNVTQADCQSQQFKGNGIYSFNAGFYVQSYCRDNTYPCTNPIPCSFSSLDHGIYALNAEFNEIIDIDSAIFKNNKTGIYMSLVSQQSINRNSFVLDENHDLSGYGDEIVIGANLEYCQNFTIEENDFLNASNLIETGGLQILNAGPHHNEIYNNSFNGHKAGIIAAGNNRDGYGTGLCIKCNDFTDCTNDIYVTNEGGSGYLGVAYKQGDVAPIPPQGQYPDPTYAAGNTFTEMSGDYTNYTNLENCHQIEYTYHGNVGNPEIKVEPDHRNPPAPSEHIKPIPDQSVTYNSKSEACPSNIGTGINLTSASSMLASESALVDAYLDTLNIYIDGGDTEGLNQEVQLSLPDEALEVRQELMSHSPYLSDTVMISSIQKENVLPNVMIRDVLVANPQSAKTPSVMQNLNARFDPMPDYMMDEIMMGQYVFGNKELLEQKLSGHKTARDRSFAKLLRHYHSDTINASSGDSIISLLYRQTYPEAHYHLALYYISHGDSANAFAIMNDIPNQFTLSPNETEICNLYSDLIEIQWDIIKDTNALDSVQIASVYDIYFHQNTLPGVFARNMLINANELQYIEPVYLPANFKVTPIWHHQGSKKQASKLLVFPNPAKTFFIVEYSLDRHYDDALLILTDISGKHIASIDAECQQNQVLVPVHDLPAGIYILRLMQGYNILESKKISISR
ncbi:MAG: T9SS type A sorting domain-containing protein, partial [Bacteroidetes bacterium]|nr:T9SS type A sorting domain-containing protein [Bacteroidota bacterium]